MQGVDELRPRQWSEKFREFTATFEPELSQRQRLFPNINSLLFGQAIYQIGQAITTANKYILDKTTSHMVDLQVVVKDMSLGRQHILTRPEDAIAAAFDGVQLLSAQYQVL